MKKKNNIDEIENLIKAIVDSPNESGNYLTLANIYMQRNELDFAVNVYESLLSIHAQIRNCCFPDSF